MKKKFLFLFVAVFLLASCTQKPAEMGNPLLSTFDTPFGVPPFQEIKVEHFIPAYEEAMKEHKLEIDVIVIYHEN